MDAAFDRRDRIRTLRQPGGIRGSFTERVDAKQATLEEGVWVLKDALVSGVGRQPESFESYLLSTYLTPERAQDAFGSVISVSFWELPDLIYRTRDELLPSETWIDAHDQHHVACVQCPLDGLQGGGRIEDDRGVCSCFPDR